MCQDPSATGAVIVPSCPSPYFGPGCPCVVYLLQISVFLSASPSQFCHTRLFASVLDFPVFDSSCVVSRTQTCVLGGLKMTHLLLCMNEVEKYSCKNPNKLNLLNKECCKIIHLL